MVLQKPLRFCATEHGVGIGLRCLPTNLVELRVESGTVLAEKNKCRFVEQSKRSLEKFVHAGDILSTSNNLCIVRHKTKGTDGRCVFGCEMLDSSEKEEELTDFSSAKPLHPNGSFFESSECITKAVPEDAVKLLISSECALKILSVLQGKLEALKAELRRKGIELDEDLVKETNPQEFPANPDNIAEEISPRETHEDDEKSSAQIEPEYIELREITPKDSFEGTALEIEETYDDVPTELISPTTHHPKDRAEAMENSSAQRRRHVPGKIVQKPNDGFVITLNPDTLKQDTINGNLQDLAVETVGFKRGVFEASQYMSKAHVRTGTSQSIRELRDTGAVGSKTEAIESEAPPEEEMTAERDSLNGLKDRGLVNNFKLQPKKVKPNSRFSVDGVRDLGLVGVGIDGHNEFISKKHARLPTTESIKELSGRDYVSSLTNIFEKNAGKT